MPKAGGVASIIGELEPHRERGEAHRLFQREPGAHALRQLPEARHANRLPSGRKLVPAHRRAAPQAPRKPLDAQGGERHAGNRIRAREHPPGGLHGLESRNVAGGLIKLFDLRPKSEVGLTMEQPFGLARNLVPAPRPNPCGTQRFDRCYRRKFSASIRPAPGGRESRIHRPMRPRRTRCQWHPVYSAPRWPFGILRIRLAKMSWKRIPGG